MFVFVGNKINCSVSKMTDSKEETEEVILSENAPGLYYGDA
jgi:hypothetical protein